ncbi:glycosyltransferase [Mariprofundus sp. NF]|uniref:glycosyltransferase n=1 Tax=Mariprofundus sp. NF TaxID=2608716 RepID=UPI0015A3AF34|nr:glycosyltransferase [Mariprofundus sp. NF]NWF39498.1 glycosyltransferase [Mariprofundus sp. NF]
MSLFSQISQTNFNIVFVIDSLELGGAEHQLVMLAEGLNKRGYHCEVFALRAEGKFREVLESLGIPVRNGRLSQGKDRHALLRGVWTLWRSINENRPCIVHTYLPLSNFIGSVVARLAGASVVITSRRDLGKHQERESRWKYFDRISNALSNIVTVNSQMVGDDTIKRDGVDKKKIVCIHNGLNSSQFDFTDETRQLMRSKFGLSSSEFAWVKVANLAERKGHIDLLKAFSTISHNHAARLFLVGEDRGAQHEIEMMVNNLGLEEQVVILGGCSNIPDILSAMDGYVMASHSEGFSNAILEAMAAGLPIVATTVGGNAEALQNGKAGLLVPPYDPVALSKAMQEAMNNQELRETVSAVAKQSSREKFSVDAMVTAYLELYHRELGR